MSLGPLASVQVYIDRPGNLLLRARVVTRQGDSAEEPHYGPNLLPASITTLPAARKIVERAIGNRTLKLEILVDPELDKPKTLNDKAVSTPRDSYGFRSAGR